MYLLTAFSIALFLIVAAQVDQKATNETKSLYKYLKTVSRLENQILFGQQEFTWLGAEGGHPPYLTDTLQHGGFSAWIYGDYQAKNQLPDDLSDVKRMTGSYPAILGMDLGDRSYKPNVTSHWLGRRAYERNEIITLSIHFKNPVTGGSPWIGGDKGTTLKTVKRILPGGDQNAKLNKVLDEVASWAHSFTDSQGKLIPAIFRYLHELNGGWFWWGLNNKAQNTAHELQELYRYSVKYLRDQKGVHNFLYAYSPDKFASKNDYLKTYPGDDFVDILGMDWYYASPSDQKTTLQRSVKDVVEIAEQKNKIPALTETGYMGDGINNFGNFWQEYILDVLKSEPTTKRIAYIHTWSNHCYGNAYCEIWVPYKGHPAEPAFVNNFYNDAMTIFSNQLPRSIY